MDGKGYGCYGLAILLLILLGSCMERPGVTQTLLQVEQLMEYDADSALLLLHQIPHPDKLRTKQRADYALLLTQAQDKTFLDSLQSDSLISIATQYYAHRKDYLRAGKAFFYHGKVQVLQGSDSLALHSYLKAEELLRKTDDYRTRARIQEYIGHLYKDLELNEVAFTYYKKALHSYKNISDSLGMAHCCLGIAKQYWHKQCYDSISYYVNEGLSLIKQDSTKTPFHVFMQLLGVVAENQRDYSSAISYYQAAINTCKVSASYPSYCMALGNIYLKQDSLERAKQYFESLLSNTNIWILAGANHHLFLLEKLRGNYLQALAYKEISDSLLTIHNQRKMGTRMLQEQHKYELHKLDLEKENLRLKMYVYLYTALFVILLLATLFFIIYIRCRKKEQEISKQSLVIRGLAENEKQLIQSHSESLKVMNQRLLCIQNENKLIKEESCVGGFYVLEALKRKQLVIEHITPKESTLLLAYIDVMFHDFATRLKSTYTLNQKKMIFAVLIRLGFDTEELAFVFDCAPDSIKRKKLRLKESLKLGKNQDLYRFLLNFSFDLSEKT